MDAATPTLTLRALIASDLRANTGRSGAGATLMYLFLSPGFLTATLHRIAHASLGYGPPGKVAAKIVWRLGVVLTSCHIDRNAVIGPSLHLPHPTGIVIGEAARVGANAMLYQNVTLGTGRIGTADHPTLGDNVHVYAGAAIIGPITIGDGAVIGAHCLVVADIPAGTVVTATPRAQTRA